MFLGKKKKKKTKQKASRALAKEFQRLLKNKIYVPKNEGNYPKHVNKLKYPSLEHAASGSWVIFSCNLWSLGV